MSDVPRFGYPGITNGDLRRAADRVEREAGGHNEEYAAGMRHARALIEEELLGNRDGGGSA